MKKESDTSYPEESKCAICGNGIPADDPTYPTVHCNCSNIIYRRMEELGMIRILSKEGATIACAFTKPFEKALDTSLADLRFRIIKDETIDDDLVVMQAVLKAIMEFLPETTPSVETTIFAQVAFNALMMRKYGLPVPDEKKFHSRVKEFAEEVFSFPVDRREAERVNDSLPCPCGSGAAYSACCKPHISMLEDAFPRPDSETLLVEWLEKYSVPISQSFKEKAGKYVFRVSRYVDKSVNQYLLLGYDRTCSDPEYADQVVYSTKNNILHSLYASMTCLSQGLFLQSGAILRSLIEDCLVLLDFFENEGQIERFLQGKYSTKGVVSRVKKLVPPCVAEWYGYFSANFTHFGPLHPAPYIPRACYPDNYVIVMGIQNMVRAALTFHLVMERIYFDHTDKPLIWKRTDDGSDIVFNPEGPVFSWAERLGEEIISQYPLREHKDGFLYDKRGYRAK